MSDQDVGGRRGRSVLGGRTEGAMNRAKDRRFPRVVLTEGAIFHKDVLHESVTVDPDAGDHQMLRVGDMVMLTEQEFDMHRAGGVALVNQVEAQAAE